MFYKARDNGMSASKWKDSVAEILGIPKDKYDDFEIQLDINNIGNSIIVLKLKNAIISDGSRSVSYTHLKTQRISPLKCLPPTTLVKRLLQ